MTREEINAMENEEVNIEEMDQEELLNNYQVVRRASSHPDYG